jgi:hypothetical protein
MKGRPVLFVIVLLMLVSSVTGCAESNSYSTTKPSVTTYTIDQVIYIAKSQYPTCFKGDLQSSPSVTATRSFPTVWKVTITCPRGYRLPDGGFSKILYFYETDGSLKP